MWPLPGKAPQGSHQRILSSFDTESDIQCPKGNWYFLMEFQCAPFIAMLSCSESSEMGKRGLPVIVGVVEYECERFEWMNVFHFSEPFSFPSSCTSRGLGLKPGDVRVGRPSSRGAHPPTIAFIV